jgi:major type 1 subunit fimbrin (pilin)
MKKLILYSALSASLGLLAATQVSAADGSIAFSGRISSSTCSIHAGTASGSQNYTVQLPTLQAATFDSAGVVAGTVPYSIFVGKPDEASCPDGTVVKVHHLPESPQIDTMTGNLRPDESSTADGVQIQILNGDQSIINLATNPDSNSYTVSGHTAELQFYGQYISTADSVTAGSVKSKVLYSMAFN